MTSINLSSHRLQLHHIFLLIAALLFASCAMEIEPISKNPNDAIINILSPDDSITIHLNDSVKFRWSYTGSVLFDSDSYDVAVCKDKTFMSILGVNAKDTGVNVLMSNYWWWFTDTSITYYWKARAFKSYSTKHAYSEIRQFKISR